MLLTTDTEERTDGAGGIPALVIRLFGRVEMEVHGQPVGASLPEKARWLLALLVLRGSNRRTKGVERTALREALWPLSFAEDAPSESTRAHYLRRTLTHLRTALGPEAGRLTDVDTAKTRLFFDLSGAEVDVLAFDSLVERRADVDALARALQLYCGPLLERCQELWALGEREARAESCRRSALTLTELLTQAGRATQAATALAACLPCQPSDWEEGLRALMRARIQANARTDALVDYRAFFARLHREDARAQPAPETRALYDSLTVPERPEATRPPGNLPVPPTPLIGREETIARIARRLAGNGGESGELSPIRLLTLTGAAGVGKTRLALAVAAAAAAASRFSSGAWMVPLEYLPTGSGPSSVLASVMTALAPLGQRPRSSSHAPADDGFAADLAGLAADVADRSLLIVLDNGEHVLDGAAAVAKGLLDRCPGLSLLVTSRQPLDLHRTAGEHLEPVTPLSSSDAYSLFVARARAVQPRLRLTTANIHAIQNICAGLEGVPLCIELAAARVQDVTLAQIQRDPIGYLSATDRGAPPRQRMAEALVRWSFDLLSVGARELLARLSVFAGGWTEAAVREVCGEETAPIYLTELVRASLISEEGEDLVGGGKRFRVLEVIRRFAADRLAESGEEEALRRQHLAWAVRLATESHTPLSVGDQQAMWATRLATEYENLRSALLLAEALATQSVQTSGRDGVPAPDSELLCLCCKLWGFWEARGHNLEGRRWCETALRIYDAAPETPPEGEGLWNLNTVRRLLGAFLLRTGELDLAEAALTRTLTVDLQLGNRLGEAQTRTNLGVLAGMRGDLTAADEQFQRNVALYQDLGEPRGEANSLRNQGSVAQRQGRHADAASLLEQAILLRRRVGPPREVGTLLVALAVPLTSLKRLDAANASLEEAVPILREAGDQRGEALAENSRGDVLLAVGDAAGAEACYRKALNYFNENGEDYHGISARMGIAKSAEVCGRLAESHSQYTEALSISERRGFAEYSTQIAVRLAGMKLAPE